MNRRSKSREIGNEARPASSLHHETSPVRRCSISPEASGLTSTFWPTTGSIIPLLTPSSSCGGPECWEARPSNVSGHEFEPIMKILFVALTSPFPPTNGHRLRVWALLQTLAQEGHSITLLILTISSEETKDFGALRDLCEHVETIPALSHSGVLAGQYLGRLVKLFSPQPYGASRFRCPLLKERVLDVLRSGDFDVVLCDGEYNMQNLPDSLPVPVLLNKDDVGYL